MDVVAAFVGALVGAIFAGVLTVIADGYRIRREHAADTYADFCSHLAALAFAESPDETRRAQSQLAATMARIAVYGKKNVVTQLAEFLDAGGTFKQDDRKGTDLVEAMRDHAGTKKMGKGSESVKTLLAGPDESTDAIA